MPIKKIAVLTSGGDSPGMNAAIRAVVRHGLESGLEVFGSRRGYQGLVDNDLIPMQRESVSNIIYQGGSILISSRCQPFMEKEGRRQAFEHCKRAGIEGLVVIGGNGSCKGAYEFSSETALPVVALPGTIDNDIYGSDMTIGFDTAVNTALESIDRIRDTASAMERIFFIEVMGRHCGNIALYAGVAGGADYVLIPERPTHIDRLCQTLKKDFGKKRTNLVVVSEGDDFGDAQKISKAVLEKTGLKSWVAKLGHIQRGGRPTARDRFFATVTATAAVDDLVAGESGSMLGLQEGTLKRIPLVDAATKKRPFNRELYDLLKLEE